MDFLIILHNENNDILTIKKKFKMYVRFSGLAGHASLAAIYKRIYKKRISEYMYIDTNAQNANE